MRKEKILAVSLAVCLFILLTTTLKFEPSALTKKQKISLQKELSCLSREENKRLKELFDHHFFFSDFAYTLFGTKPMSIGRFHPTQKTRMGWEAWEKINGSFTSKRFIIRKYTCNDHEFILVANLKKIEQIYYQNQIRFDQAFKGRMTFNVLITCLMKGGPLFQELMQDHLLVGILLGYGTHNAELFSQNQKLSVRERNALYASSWKIHPIFYIFSRIMPVSFACDPCTEETKELKKRYTKERKDILKMAKRDPLFIQMLIQLSASD
jgi:hypothetical protein